MPWLTTSVDCTMTVHTRATVAVLRTRVCRGDVVIMWRCLGLIMVDGLAEEEPFRVGGTHYIGM